MKFWLDRDESKRLAHIVHVLFDNQMGFYISKLNLRRKLPFSKKMKDHKFKEAGLTPQILRKIFEDIGGTFLKLGQLLSLRPDLIPVIYCEELSKLQDNVKPFSGKQAREIIEKELGKPINKLFLEFDETPVAAASLGQVHAAKLKDGTRVAVKVQRPDITRTFKVDIKLLYRLAAAIKKRYGTKFVNPVEIAREFERYTDNEMNYLKEAHNIDLFYHNFLKSNTILIPKVFWTHTTSKVLTMEYIAGKRLTDISKFKPADKKRIINTILEAEFQQIFIDGIFHADPHPGNFLIKTNGKIALLDFGIVGRLSPLMKEHMTDFFISLTDADVEKMVSTSVKLGVVSDDVNMEKVKQDLYDKMSAYYGTSIDKIKTSRVLNDLILTFRENDLKVLPNFVLLAKATITLESVAAKLDPKLNFVEVARPFVKKILVQRLKPRQIADRAKRKIEAMLEFTESIPRKTTTLIEELHDTDRDLRRIDNDISNLAVEMDRSSNRVTLGFLAGTLFIASTVLLPYQTAKVAGVPALSFIGYITALIVMISIFISMLKEKKPQCNN